MFSVLILLILIKYILKTKTSLEWTNYSFKNWFQCFKSVQNKSENQKPENNKISQKPKKWSNISKT